MLYIYMHLYIQRTSKIPTVFVFFIDSGVCSSIFLPHRGYRATSQVGVDTAELCLRTDEGRWLGGEWLGGVGEETATTKRGNKKKGNFHRVLG